MLKFFLRWAKRSVLGLGRYLIIQVTVGDLTLWLLVDNRFTGVIISCGCATASAVKADTESGTFVHSC